MYYYFQATLHGLSFYEGILNEAVTIDAIKKAEKWLRDAERIIDEARNIDASPLADVEMRRKKVQAEISSKSRELIELREERSSIIERLRRMRG